MSIAPPKSENLMIPLGYQPNYQTAKPSTSFDLQLLQAQQKKYLKPKQLLVYYFSNRNLECHQSLQVHQV